MSTSGVSTFNATRNEIIRSAARKVQAIGTGVTMSSEMLAEFDHALNAMIKRWQAKGIHVWTTSEGTLFPQPEQIRYAIGPSMADHVSATNSYSATETSADEASGQTIISVLDTSNIVVNDKAGILIDDGTLHWSTVTAKSSTTITIAVALPDTSAEGSTVYTYATNIVRPLKIVDARLFKPTTGEETPIAVVPRLDYQNLPRKTEAGSITQLFYDPQLSTGYVNLWQAPRAVDELVRFTWHRPIEDFSVAGDNPDLPQEWIDTLEFNLALVMAVEKDVPTEKFGKIKLLADQFLDDLTGFDRENESISFEPDLEG